MNAGLNSVSPIGPEGSPPPRSLLARVAHRLARAVPGLLALLAVAGLALIGHKTHWSMPKFSALTGQESAEEKDWCEAHSVPDSICVECRKDCMPRIKEYGWCKVHGIHECPFEHPDLAQLPTLPVITPEDLDRARRALQFVPRLTNESKCKLHQRVIQFMSDEAVNKVRLEVAPARRGGVTEFVTANGEIGFDETRVARLSSRVPGAVWRMLKQPGDKVVAGETLALVEAAEVGRAKSDFLQALTQADLKTKVLATLRASSATVAGRDFAEAEGALDEARIRLATSELTLQNLGLPIKADELRGLSPDETVKRVRFLGLPTAFTASLDPQATSGNLIPVKALQSGVVVDRAASAGEIVEPTKALYVVADISRMWLTLEVRLEDARRLALGQSVRFRPDGAASEVVGRIAWLSTAVDEKTRAVKVRVDLPNPTGDLRARTFGAGKIILREEPNAIVVPSEAVHWEGDCHVVFVRDKDFEKPDAKKVFHVRKVRTGAKSADTTEIIAGVLPGELVATGASGVLRSELLKNNLGAG